MIYNIAVFGSCASRDNFYSGINPDYKKYFNCSISSQRGSIISLMQESVSFKNQDIQILPENRVNKAGTQFINQDLTKNFLAEVKKFKPDYILIDNYFEVIFGIIKYENCFITNNYWDLPKTRFHTEIKPYTKINMYNDPNTYLKLYKENMNLFLDYIQKESPNSQIILNPVRLGYKILKDDNNIEVNKNLEQLMKCIFDDWFVNFNYSENILFKSSELGEIPSNWNVKNLGEVLITLESGKRPKGGISDIDDGIPSIGAENILGLGKFDYSKNKLISYDFFNQMKKGIIHNQDVLLYKDGAQLGRKSLFMNKFPFDVCCINEHVFRLQSNDEISQFYLYLWLDQPIITNEIINLNSNSAQPGINQTDVKSLPILVPDFEIMTKFENIISPMMNQIFDNALEINKLSKLRDILLPKLMSGEINVSKINCDLIIVTFYFYFEILFN